VNQYKYSKENWPRYFSHGAARLHGMLLSLKRKTGYRTLLTFRRVHKGAYGENDTPLLDTASRAWSGQRDDPPAEIPFRSQGLNAHVTHMPLTIPIIWAPSKSSSGNSWIHASSVLDGLDGPPAHYSYGCIIHGSTCCRT
jgi:hypothetical protein